MDQLSYILPYIINTKNGQLQHLTGERDKRRCELRDLAKKIETADQIEIRPLLAGVKVRIDAYGMEQAYDDNFFRDSHIWDCIEMLEDCQSDEDFVNHKELLIDYLSILLKSDWDHSKSAAAGMERERANHYFFYIYIAFYIFFYVYIWKLPFTVSFASQIGGLATLYFALCEIVLIVFEKSVNCKAEKNFGKRKNYFCMDIHLCIARRVSILVELFMSIYPLLIWENTPPEIYISMVSGRLIPMGLTYVLICILVFCDISRIFKHKKNYVLSILAATQKYDHIR